MRVSFGVMRECHFRCGNDSGGRSRAGGWARRGGFTKTTESQIWLSFNFVSFFCFALLLIFFSFLRLLNLIFLRISREYDYELS